MSEPIRILALHAHPDDVEFQCAGTLVLLREAGCLVTIATMTPGDCGSAEHDAEAIAAIRRDEARASAALIGADYLCLEFRDLAIFNDDESRRRVTEVLRRTRPDLILTAPADRLHRRSRDDQPAGPRRLLRGILPELRDATVGARTPAAEDPPPLLRRSPGGARPRRAAGARRFPRRRLAGLRRRSARCWPVTPASATGCSASTGSTSTWRCRPAGEPAGARRSAWPRPRHSASIAVIRIPHDNILLRLGRAGRPRMVGAITGHGARSDAAEASVTASRRRRR